MPIVMGVFSVLDFDTVDAQTVVIQDDAAARQLHRATATKPIKKISHDPGTVGFLAQLADSSEGIQPPFFAIADILLFTIPLESFLPGHAGHFHPSSLFFTKEAQAWVFAT